MKYLKKFNEGWFSGEGSLQSEAEEKFDSLVKDLDRKIKNSKDGSIEVYQNPTFKTKSTRSINDILMGLVEKYYKDKGFLINRSHDGSNLCKDDWFRIKATEKYGEFATEVRDFSETHLAYLLDDYKFELKVGTYPYHVDNDYNYGLGTEGISSIVIESNDSDGENLPFQWEEISNNFIPFFTLLSRKYEIEEFRINNTESFNHYNKIESDYYTVSQVINNRITTKNCEEIIIKVSRKKEGTLQKIKSFFK